MAIVHIALTTNSSQPFDWKAISKMLKQLGQIKSRRVTNSTFAEIVLDTLVSLERIDRGFRELNPSWIVGTTRDGGVKNVAKHVA